MPADYAIDDFDITITIYDKACNRKGFLGDPTSLTITPRRNEIGTASIEIAADNPKRPFLAAPGARLVVQYQDAHLMSGKIVGRSGTGTGPESMVTFALEDDFRIVHQLLGWPAPASAYNSQGTAYDKRTGPAETVVKGFLSANAARLPKPPFLPVSVVASRGAGATVTVQSRMDLLADKLIPILNANNLILQVKQVGTGLVVDVFSSALYPTTLTESGGMVLNPTWNVSDPTMTRAIVGGQGELTAREFQLVIDTALEAAYGEVIEGFVDARDTNVTAEIIARGQAALIENGPKASVSAELAETEDFRFAGLAGSTGRGIRIGDRANVEVSEDVNGTPVTAVGTVTEAPFTFSVDEGLKIVPTLGERADDTDKTLVATVMKASQQARAFVI